MRTAGGASRRAGIMVAVLVVTAVLSGCQAGKVGGRCKAGTVAQDATHVLVCQKGRWKRLISKADGLRKLAEIKAAEERAKLPPPTTTPVVDVPVDADPPAYQEPIDDPPAEEPSSNATVSTVLAAVADPPCSGCSLEFVVSASGRFVAFETNRAFDPADTDFAPDLYLLDTTTGSVRWISRSTAFGTQYWAYNSLGMDDAGTTVVYVTPVGDVTETFTYDIASDTLTQPVGRGAQAVAISANGRHLAIAGSDADRIFMIDRTTGERTTRRFQRSITTLTSLNVSDDGQVVTGGAHFAAADGVGSGDDQLFRDTEASGTMLYPAGTSNLLTEATADGRFLVTVANGTGWLIDTVTGATVDLTDGCSWDGLCVGASVDISSDGRFVSFLGYPAYGTARAYVVDLDDGGYWYAGNGAVAVRLTGDGMMFLAPPDSGSTTLGLSLLAPLRSAS